MLLGITVVLICLCLNYRKSQVLAFILQIWLWVLYAWSSGTADFSIYENRYNLYGARISYTEPIYTTIVRIAHYFKLDFRSFMIVSVLIAMFLMYKTANDFSINVGEVIGLYAIFPFVMDVTIMRYFIAQSIIIYGFRFLMNDEKENSLKNTLYWCICVLLASGIHMLCILFLLFLIPKYCSVKKTTMITVIGIGILYICLNRQIAYRVISLLVSSEKANMVLGGEYSKTRQLINIIRILLIFVEFLVLWFTLKNRKTTIDEKVGIGFHEKIMKMNIIMLLILPISTVVSDCFRIQTTLTFFNYIYFSYYFHPVTAGKLSVKQASFNLEMIFFAVLNLYMLVLRSENLYTVFWPVFHNNVLF